jgi:hypothetical protein
LLTLARYRLRETEQGLTAQGAGWLCAEDFAHDPTTSPTRINLDVFRIRRQFASAGVIGASRIVERRRLTKQLRIGTEHITIMRT